MKKFGRKQIIGMSLAIPPYLMNYALVWAGKLSGEAFWASSWPYISSVLAVLLGAAALKEGLIGRKSES